MRALIQRVSQASVSVDGEVLGAIDHGLLILVCAMAGDDESQCQWLAEKIVKLRIFKDDNGKMNRALNDIEGAALVVSQFTLAAETKGNRPGFSRAADPATGQALYELFCQKISNLGPKIATGRFGADMQVALINDGPVTIWIDSQNR